MAERQNMSIGRVNLGEGTVHVVTGAANTRAAVVAECPASAPDSIGIGSLYLSSKGNMYVRVAAAGAETDFQKVTTTAAD